jgi:endonuclease/exonuclease/phosphatase family metal-dependent hydrolase
MSVALWSVTSWNVRGSARPPIDALADAIATCTPDVVAVQEIRARQADALAEALRMDVRWSCKHFPYTPLLYRKAEGLAVLSPHRVEGSGSAELTLGESRSVYRRRIVQWADISRDDGARMRVYNAHLASGHDLYERRAQAARLAHLVARHRNERPVVVAGDLNDDTDGEVIASLPGVEHVTPPPSNPAGAPTQSLDHVLLPREAIEVTASMPDGGEEWAELSDHLPLTVRFALR